VRVPREKPRMVGTELGGALVDSPPPAHVQYKPESCVPPGCGVRVEHPVAGAETGTRDDTWPPHELAAPPSVLRGTPAPMQTKLEETECVSPSVMRRVETEVHPITAPAKLVSVVMKEVVWDAEFVVVELGAADTDAVAVRGASGFLVGEALPKTARRTGMKMRGETLRGIILKEG
jgi:hypothetical protein